MTWNAPVNDIRESEESVSQIRVSVFLKNMVGLGRKGVFYSYPAPNLKANNRASREACLASKGHMYPSVHCSTVNNSSDTEAT